jgi:type II secretory ATPase GspE/PulE/Tfp pilus assembly ATPase PilB-like protein
MANNIVKFKELQSYMPSDVEVLTLSTEEFIKSAGNSTMKFLDFVFGANNTIISREKRWEAALSQQKGFDKMKKRSSSHITQSSTTEEKENKEKLKELLHSDKDLAPILKLTESLVNEALSASTSSAKAKDVYVKI